MHSISEQLQRMKELALRASNGTLNNSDKLIIQDEIKQIKESINMTVSNTKYNGQRLLDGSFINKNSATGADGKGVKLSIDGISLSQLALEDFSVVGEFDIESINNAIKTVSGVRSSLGAISNRLNNSITYNKVSVESTFKAQNKLEDSDLTKEIIKSKNNQILEQFKINMQKKAQEEEKSKLNLVL